MNVLISIPAYNEEKTIGNLISEIKKVMSNTKYKYNIQVIDDGSKDRTSEAANKEGALVFRHNYNRGLAEAFRTELKKFLESNADILVHIDADSQYLPSDIPKLIKEIENGYDLVLGDRFSGKIEYMPLQKRLTNRAFSRAISKIIRYKVNDCQTGFRAFTRQVAKEIPIISNHTYTQEQIIRAVRDNFKIKEVPVNFLKRKDGKSKLISNIFEYGIKAWINIFRIYRDYEPLKFFGRIGALFFTLGTIFGLYLLYIYFLTGKVSRLPLTILTILLIITGVQIILFGFLADMNRK